MKCLRLNLIPVRKKPKVMSAGSVRISLSFLAKDLEDDPGAYATEFSMPPSIQRYVDEDTRCLLVDDSLHSRNPDDWTEEEEYELRIGIENGVDVRDNYVRIFNTSDWLDVAKDKLDRLIKLRQAAKWGAKK